MIESKTDQNIYTRKSRVRVCGEFFILSEYICSLLLCLSLRIFSYDFFFYLIMKLIYNLCTSHAEEKETLLRISSNLIGRLSLRDSETCGNDISTQKGMMENE